MWKPLLMTVIFGASALTTGVCGAQSATQRIGFVKQTLETTCGEFEGRDIAGGGLLGAIGLDAKTMAFRYANFHVINNELRYSQYRVTKRGNVTDGVSGTGSLFHYAVRLAELDVNRMRVQEVRVDNDNLGIFFFNLTCTGTGAKCVSRHATAITAPRRTLEGVNQRLDSYVPAASGTAGVQEIANIHVCNHPSVAGGAAAAAERIRNEMIAAINAVKFGGEIVNISIGTPVAALPPQVTQPPPVFSGSTPAPAFSAAPAPVFSGTPPVVFGGANLPPISAQTPFAPRGPIPLFPRN